MKHISFFTMMIALMAIFFAACGDDSSSGTGPNGSGGTVIDGGKGNTVSDADLAKAFFPEGYDKADVVAWFFCPNVDRSGDRTEAIYIFKDYSWVMAGLKTDNGKQTRIIEDAGDATLKSGDFDNGVFSLLYGGTEYDIEIKNGQFTMDKTFSRQPLDKIPVPTKADVDDSGDVQHGEYTDQLVNPYFPSGYEGKKIAAWYGFTNVEGDRVKTCTIYLFDDNTAIETEYHYTSHNDLTQNTLEITGTYSIDGDYENGSITLNAETGVGTNVGFQTITSKIEKGVITIGGEPFTKQDNSKVPAASNEKQGGNDQNGEVANVHLTELTAEWRNGGLYVHVAISGWIYLSDSEKEKFQKCGFIIDKYTKESSTEEADEQTGEFWATIPVNSVKGKTVKAFVEYNGEKLYSSEIAIPPRQETPVNLTVLVNIVDASRSSHFGVFVAAQIDEYSDLGLDVTKLTFGFVVAEKGGNPTLEDNIYKTENNGGHIGVGGGWSEDMEETTLYDRDLVVRAYVVYDGKVFYSSAYSTDNGDNDPIEDEGDEADLLTD
jgi:hypothetical protein